MPKAAAAPAYQPIPLSDLSPENVVGHINNATQFLDKFRKTSRKRRDALGGDGEHLPKNSAVHL